jgi:hypothetical protein
MELYRNRLQLHRAGAELPAALAKRSDVVDITPANAGTECGRCNRAYADHLWILRDPDDWEQGGVIDCAPTN